MIIRILSWLIVSSALLYAELGIEGWVEGTDYDPSIPTYAEVLGYAPGEALTTHREMLRYLSTLAAASDRVVLETYGESYQGRELAIAVVSSPDNLASIEQIYTDFQLLVDPRRSGNRERIIENRPVAVYLVYSIHGDEHSCTEAALLTAYHLAADRSEATRDILENTIIVIDPLLNPDGRMRYLGYLENTQSFPANPDPNAVEHNPYPIGGRTNHYLFDLNRDWFAVTQQESRARVKQVQRWRPQVLGSYHEMGYRSSYYFAPPAEAVNKNFSPIVMKWLEVFGRENARAFDQRGWRYFTKEIFDSFYPGYGDSWPILNGVVAMTFEQASAEGSLIQKPDGHLLTLREAIEHHFVTGITTVTTASANRKALLRDFHEQFKTALNLGKRDALSEYILPMGPEFGSNADLAELLLFLGIEVEEAEHKFSVKRAATHLGKSVGRKDFGEGTLIIPLEQPHYVLLKTLFEPASELDPSFIQEELQRHQERLPDRIYDVTAWSLPLLYDAIVYTTNERSTVRTKPVDKLEKQGRVVLSSGSQQTYAYLVPYHTHTTLSLLSYLWNEGIKVHFSRESFTHSSKRYPRGSLTVFASGNPPELQEVIQSAADSLGVMVDAVTTGLTEEGIDLGSNNIVHLKQPRILLLYPEPPISGYSYGNIAWLLEQEYGLRFTAAWPWQLGRIDLRDYDVLIVPHLNRPELDAFKGKVYDELVHWIRHGGTLIALKGAAAYFAENDSILTTIRLVRDIRPEEQAASSNEQDVPREYRPKTIPGAIFRVTLNHHHYLSFGYDEDTYVLVWSDLIFLPSQDGFNVATFPKGGGKVSGFTWEGAEAQLSEKVYLVDEHVGEGHIILFADDPNFRGYMRGLNRLFMNAVMLSSSVRR